jgi:glucose-6-phosphate 1-dehydrogenase
MVIFGATGDLTQRKLIPALYNLARDGQLPEAFAVVGVAIESMDRNQYQAFVSQRVPEHLGSAYEDDIWRWLCERLYYVGGDFNSDSPYSELGAQIEALHNEGFQTDNILFYLSVPPRLFEPIAERLHGHNLLAEDEYCSRRLVIEKPFGHDRESAKSLNRTLWQLAREEQIYRIDHYLGKETVQNLLVFRYGNGIFEPIWNRHYIDHIQITVAEDLGVGTRGGYYEEAGALRDMVPNHMFQLLSLTAMEPPTCFQADAVRDKKGEVLTAVQPLKPEEVLTHAVRGQYGAGQMPDGTAAAGYREAEDVAPESSTETYAALKLMIDNWRWADVPFYLRTGKRLPERRSEIVVQFKRAPTNLFPENAADSSMNQLVIRIQPRQGINLRFGAKQPGPAMTMTNVDMDFCYADYFGTAPATGYETLLHDALQGDATLFQRADSIEQAWSVIQPVLDVWQSLPARDFPNYSAGTWGPKDAEELLSRDGRAWKNER